MQFKNWHFGAVMHHSGKDTSEGSSTRAIQNLSNSNSVQKSTFRCSHIKTHEQMPERAPHTKVRTSVGEVRDVWKARHNLDIAIAIAMKDQAFSNTQARSRMQDMSQLVYRCDIEKNMSHTVV